MYAWLHDGLKNGVRRAVSYLESASHEMRDMRPRRADQLLAWRTVFAEHPLLGVGPGGFAVTIPELVPGGLAQEMHNSYLGVLAETGDVRILRIFFFLAAAIGNSVTLLRLTQPAYDPWALLVP